MLRTRAIVDGIETDNDIECLTLRDWKLFGRSREKFQIRASVLSRRILYDDSVGVQGRYGFGSFGEHRGAATLAGREVEDAFSPHEFRSVPVPVEVLQGN